MSVLQIKNSFTSMGALDASTPPSSLMLKISVGRNAIRYFIQSLAHDQVIFFGDYTLHHVESEDELIQRFERIYEHDEALQLAFYKVIIGIDSPYTLIPAGFFLPVETANETTINQKIDALGLEMVFNVNFVLNYKLRSLLRNSNIVHLNSSLLKTLPGGTTDLTEFAFLQITPTYFDFIRFNQIGQLQLMNRYEYKTETDLIYFVLLCSEELNINRETINLVLIGEVDKDSKVYEICYRYFRNVQFKQQPETLEFSKAMDEFPRHHHYNLYTLTA